MLKKEKKNPSLKLLQLSVSRQYQFDRPRAITRKQVQRAALMDQGHWATNNKHHWPNLTPESLS